VENADDLTRDRGDVTIAVFAAVSGEAPVLRGSDVLPKSRFGP
jgi:hypothetical protein